MFNRTRFGRYYLEQLSQMSKIKKFGCYNDISSAIRYT